MGRSTRFLRHLCVATGLLLATAPVALGAVVIHWKLDESSGTSAADTSAVNGTQNGTSAAASPQWQPTGGILGGALRFSAVANTNTGENVSFTSGSNIAAYPFSIGTWIRSTASANYRETFAFLGTQATVDQYVQTSMDPNNTGTPSRAQAGARNTILMSAVGGDAVNDDAWHHVVGVYTSASSRSLYVDGRLIATNSSSVTLPATTRFSIAAAMRSSPGEAYNGLIDDVGLWNESLTPVRIALINGLGRYSGVVLDDPSIAQVESVFTARNGTADAGPLTWTYATGLPSTTIGATGTIDGSSYIVLASNGDGVQSAAADVPEPTAALIFGLPAAFATLTNRRRRRP